MIINIQNKESLKEAAKILKEGGVLVFPTDTVYGIGCLPKEEAIKKLYKIKNRKNQPTAILLTKKLYFQIADRQLKSNISRENLKNFKKGRLTLVMKTKHFRYDFPEIILKDDKVGLRLPKYVWLEELIKKVGPIVTSSANIKGKPAPRNFDEIDNNIIEKADLVIRTQEKLSGKPSRVYDVEDDKFIRN